MPCYNIARGLNQPNKSKGGVNNEIEKKRVKTYYG